MAPGRRALAVLLYSFVLTGVIGLILHKTLGFRASEGDELAGLDSTEHAETGYDLGNLAGTLRSTGALGTALTHGRDDTPAPTDQTHDQEVTA